MSYIKKWRPAPGTVLGTIAIFISLGGVSYGVATGSINSREIKNNTVKSKDIKNNSVAGKDLKNGSVTSRDVKNNSLTDSDVLESSLGTVPSADTANTANAATAANAAKFAAVAGSITGFSHVSVTAADGGADKPLFTINGFQVYLRCDFGGPFGDANVIIKNVSAGAHAAVDADEAVLITGTDKNDFAVGNELLINTPSPNASPNIDELGPYFAIGSKGAISGNVSVAAGYGANLTDCAASGTGTG